jgi:hypothetical protein
LGRDGEDLSSGDGEVVGVAAVVDVGEPGGSRLLHKAGRVVGSELQPGSEAGAVVIGGIVVELDTQAAAARESDEEHPAGDARVLDVDDGAVEEGRETGAQLVPPVGSSE